jgi:hypothetical protein
VFVGDDEGIIDQKEKEETWSYVGGFKGVIVVRRFNKCKKFNASKLMIIMEQLGLNPFWFNMCDGFQEKIWHS